MVGCLPASLTIVCLTDEDTVYSTLFLYEPDLVNQLASLLHHDVDDTIAMAAVFGLDACSHHRSKTPEVLTAVSANVNHGIIISLFRNIVTKLVAGSEFILDRLTIAPVPYELVDAVIGFISFIASSPPHGNMLVSAGILPLLLEMLDSRGERRDHVSCT
jgi:E3 ubiquitin-protein ligase HUWE1